MTNLKVTIAGGSFKNPVITASGCFGFGREYECMYPLEKLGGISLKGMTFQEKLGNPPPRIAETPSGMLNSVGLQNPGVEHFLEHDMPYLAKQDTSRSPTSRAAASRTTARLPSAFRTVRSTCSS